MIWGSAKSYIINGATTITLNKSQTSINFFQNQDVAHQSILTGVMTHSSKGDYSDFTVTERCWQETDPSAKFSSIMGCEGQNITFYLHGSGLIADCYVKYIRPFYFNSLINYDGVVIFLEPTTYFRIAAPLLNLDGTPLLNLDGEPLYNSGMII